MSIAPQGEGLDGGALNAAISNAMVRLWLDYHGRGPTRVHTQISGGVVQVILEDTLTKAERVLVAKGREQQVLDMRSEFQLAIKDDATAAIERLTGRPVAAMMSANHVAPDLAAELFVLEPPPADDARSLLDHAAEAVIAAERQATEALDALEADDFPGSPEERERARADANATVRDCLLVLVHHYEDAVYRASVFN